MKRSFRELTSSDIRNLNGSLCRLDDCESWDELGYQSVVEMMQLIGADNACYNQFDRNFAYLEKFHQTREIQSTCDRLHEAFNQHMAEHPVLSVIGWQGLGTETRLMSDWISDRQLQDNALYREAYRFIDAKYQLSRAIDTIDDKGIAIVINRAGKDFSKNEIQMAEIFSLRFKDKLNQLSEKLRLKQCLLQLLTTFSHYFSSEQLLAITVSELAILEAYLCGWNAKQIASARNIKANTVYKHTQSICEKLGTSSIQKTVALMKKAVHERA